MGSPLVKALQLEGFYSFEEPCYEDKDKQDVPCTYGSPWSQYAQQVMAGVTAPTLTYEVKDQFFPAAKVFPDPLPSAKSNCTSPPTAQHACLLNMTSVSQAIYDKGNDKDLGFVHTSAEEVRCKLTSREKSMKAIGMPAQFNVTDAPSLCAEINQKALDWAASVAPATTRARYLAKGVKMAMAADELYSPGPFWIWAALSFKNDGSSVKVASPAMKTPVHYWLKLSAGFHFCKLLSPARALEHMYIDSLRQS